MSCFQSSCPFRCDRGDSLQLRGRRALTKLGETLSPSFAYAKTCHLFPPLGPRSWIAQSLLSPFSTVRFNLRDK